MGSWRQIAWNGTGTQRVVCTLPSRPLVPPRRIRTYATIDEFRPARAMTSWTTVFLSLYPPLYNPKRRGGSVVVVVSGGRGGNRLEKDGKIERESAIGNGEGTGTAGAVMTSRSRNGHYIHVYRVFKINEMSDQICCAQDNCCPVIFSFNIRVGFSS